MILEALLVGSALSATALLLRKRQARTQKDTQHSIQPQRVLSILGHEWVVTAVRDYHEEGLPALREVLLEDAREQKSLLEHQNTSFFLSVYPLPETLQGFPESVWVKEERYVLRERKVALCEAALVRYALYHAPPDKIFFLREDSVREAFVGERISEGLLELF